MKLTKVEAGSMQEALRKIRTTLGDEALIVGTRSFRRGGVLGVGGREVVEVYVTDPRPHGRAAPAAPAAILVEQAPRVPQAAAAQCGPNSPEELKALSQALDSLRDEIRTLVREKEDVPDHPFLRDALTLLLERDVEAKLAARVVSQMASLPLPIGLPDHARVRAVVAAQIRKLFLPNVPAPVDRPPRVVVLVGPTGVGKTTTIAKLAARARIAEGKKVSLVTLDTFRIAAVDQLQKYAQIIGMSLAVASDPIEFQSAVRTFAAEKSDVIFVDSAGRSQRDEMKMTELKEFLQVLPEAEVHLVLSATTQPRTMRSVAARFAQLGFQRVILTKLDEAAGFGAILGALVEMGKPVSFLTDGQNVPDDIMTSDPERLADLVLRANNG
jgi:flagellar biosynthesis protein FlhF